MERETLAILWEVLRAPHEPYDERRWLEVPAPSCKSQSLHNQHIANAKLTSRPTDPQCSWPHTRKTSQIDDPEPMSTEGARDVRTGRDRRGARHLPILRHAQLRFLRPAQRGDRALGAPREAPYESPREARPQDDLREAWARICRGVQTDSVEGGQAAPPSTTVISFLFSRGWS